MANPFLRLSSSFACVPVKLAVGRKWEIVLAYIVEGVHFEAARIWFSLKYLQKTKKDEPEKMKKELRLSSSFRVSLFSLFAYTSTKHQLLVLQNGLHNVSEGYFLFPFSDKFNQTTSKRRRKSKKEVCHPYYWLCNWTVKYGTVYSYFFETQSLEPWKTESLCREERGPELLNKEPYIHNPWSPERQRAYAVKREVLNC